MNSTTFKTPAASWEVGASEGPGTPAGGRCLGLAPGSWGPPPEGVGEGEGSAVPPCVPSPPARAFQSQG